MLVSVWSPFDGVMVLLKKRMACSGSNGEYSFYSFCSCVLVSASIGQYRSTPRAYKLQRLLLLRWGGRPCLHPKLFSSQGQDLGARFPTHACFFVPTGARAVLSWTLTERLGLPESCTRITHAKINLRAFGHVRPLAPTLFETT